VLDHRRAALGAGPERFAFGQIRRHFLRRFDGEGERRLLGLVEHQLGGEGPPQAAAKPLQRADSALGEQRLGFGHVDLPAGDDFHIDQPH